PRDSVPTSPSVAPVRVATAHKRSRNTTQKILPSDKVPRKRSYLRRGESCRPTRSNSSHRRRSARAWKPRLAREAPGRFFLQPSFDLLRVRSFVSITLRRV